MIAKLIKRFSLMGIFLALIYFAGCLPTGDTLEVQKSAADFVGSYTSIYENGIRNGNTSFDLEIKEDKTFTLQGNGKDVWGTWKSKTVNGDVQVICLPMEKEKSTQCEFTLTMLDDGTVMAKTEVLEYTSIIFDKTYIFQFSVFGSSKIDDNSYYYITTVVFEKN